MRTLDVNDMQDPNEPGMTPPPSQTPNDQPKKRKKLVLIVAVIVLTLLIAGLLGWYFYMKKDDAAKKSADTAKETPATPETKPVGGPDASLKCPDAYSTFADKGMGMTFCYPTEWGTPTMHDAKVAPADTGYRENITFSNSPFFAVGGTSDSWTTTVGRGVGCLEPNNAALALSAYDTTWHGLVGSGADVEFATRSLPAPTGGYDSTESVSNILDSGVCTQAHKIITGSRYRIGFAAFSRDFAPASGITTPRLHMDHPEVLFSTLQRQQFDAVMASLTAY